MNQIVTRENSEDVERVTDLVKTGVTRKELARIFKQNPFKLPRARLRNRGVSIMRQRVVRWLQHNGVKYPRPQPNLILANKVFEMAGHSDLVGRFGKKRSKHAIVIAHHIIGSKILPPIKDASWVERRDRRIETDRVKAFYRSYEWRKLRYATLMQYGARCMVCKRPASEELVIHVDHIRPIRKFWYLRLDPNNVQVLCEDCNHGKGNWDETDWRPNPSRRLDPFDMLN